MRRTPALLAALCLGGAIAATSATHASAFDPVPAPDSGVPSASAPAPMSYSALRAVFRVLAPPLVGDSYPSESPKVTVGGPALTEAVLDLTASRTDR